MPRNLKKDQMTNKKAFESSIDTISSKTTKEFESVSKEINALLDDFYTQFNLSQETIDLLRGNPEFAIGIEDIRNKSDKQIEALFKNYQESTGTNLVAAHNVGFAQRIWEAEISQSIIYEVETQPLPFVEDLLLNKDIFGFSTGNRIKMLSVETKEAVQDWLEMSLMSGNSIKETAQGIRDIIGFDVDGNRQKGALARANRISRTEIRRAYNTGADLANQELKGLGVDSSEKWIATLDKRTRPYHLAADNQIKGTVIPNKFLVGGEVCDHPQDAGLSARNSINCRCYVEYTTEPDTPTLRAVRTQEKLPNGRRAMPKNLEDASWRQWRKQRLGQLGITTEGF